MDLRTRARDLRNMVFAGAAAAGQGEMSVAKLKHVSITIVVACAAVMEIRFIVIFDWRSGATEYDAMRCSLLGREVLSLRLPAPHFEAIDCSEAPIVQGPCPRTRSNWSETGDQSQP